MLVADRKNKILRRSYVTFSDLKLALVLPGEQHVLRNLIERLSARRRHRAERRDRKRFADRDHAARSLGYMTIMPHFAMLDEIKREEIGTVPITDPTPSWRMSAVVSQRTINMRSSEAVAKTLVEDIRSKVKWDLEGTIAHSASQTDLFRSRSLWALHSPLQRRPCRCSRTAARHNVGQTGGRYRSLGYDVTRPDDLFSLARRRFHE